MFLNYSEIIDEPAGNCLLAYRSEHYQFANSLGIAFQSAGYFEEE